MDPSPLVTNMSVVLIWLAALAVVPRTYVPAVYALSKTEEFSLRERVRFGLEAVVAFTFYGALVAGVVLLHRT